MLTRSTSLAVRTCTVAMLVGLSACAWSGSPRPPSPPPMPQPAEQPEPPPPRSYEDHLRDGDLARSNGDVSKAAWAYFRALRMRSSDPLARERIGYLHLNGDVEQARAIFDRIVADSPDAAPAWLGRGLAELSQRKLGAAEMSFTRALDVDPENEIAALALGVLSDWKKDHTTARAFYARAQQVNPMRAETYINLGISYMFTMEFQAAALSFERSISLDASDPAAYNNLGLALGRMRRYDESLDAFRRNGSEASAQNNAGYVRYLNGEYEQAIQHYEAALGMQPEERLTIIRNLITAEEALHAGRSEPADEQEPLAPAAEPLLPAGAGVPATQPAAVAPPVAAPASSAAPAPTGTSGPAPAPEAEPVPAGVPGTGPAAAPTAG